MKCSIVTILLATLSSVYAVERPIVVIIPSYNNIQWYERNVESACSQEYQNYRVIYIDDASKDGTGNAVSAYIKQHNLQNRVTFIQNMVNVGALANIYDAVHSCADNEIVVLLDGDDWFKHTRVLQTINNTYNSGDVWMTYGQFETYPQGTVGYCADIPQHVIEQNAFRKYVWVSSHVRTFYAKLFKNIQTKDLIADNEFMRVTWDMALMMPMLEMAGDRIRCISDVLYVYNEANPINDFKVRLRQQLQYERMIRNMPSYERLPRLFNEDVVEDHEDVAVSWVYHDFDAAMRVHEFPRALPTTQVIVEIDGQRLYNFFKDLYEQNNLTALAKKGIVVHPKIPKIIHQIWIGGPLPEAFKELCESWKHYHNSRGWLYKLWTDEDVKQLALHNQAYYDESDNPGVKSDLLKWELIYNFGGFYLDVDYEAFKALDTSWKSHTPAGAELSYSLLCYDFITALQPLDTQFVQLGAALFGARPYHPILEHCIATVKDDWHHQGAPKKTGPVHFTKSFFATAGRDGNIDIALPAFYVYPLGCTQKELRYDEWLREGAYAVHHWAKSWMPPRFRLEKFKMLANDIVTESWND